MKLGFDYAVATVLEVVVVRYYSVIERVVVVARYYWVHERVVVVVRYYLVHVREVVVARCYSMDVREVVVVRYCSVDVQEEVGHVWEAVVRYSVNVRELAVQWVLPVFVHVREAVEAVAGCDLLLISLMMCWHWWHVSLSEEEEEAL